MFTNNKITTNIIVNSFLGLWFKGVDDQMICTLSAKLEETFSDSYTAEAILTRVMLEVVRNEL